MDLALVVWTLAVWATRIRNIVGDDGGAADLVVPVGLTALALAALVDRARGNSRLVVLLGVATVAVWAVRLPLLVVHDHSVAFTLVHVVLALVSTALAAVVFLRHRDRTSVSTSS